MTTQTEIIETQYIRPGIDAEAFDAYLTRLYAADQARREAEVEAAAAEAGVKLPMPASVILKFEAAGATVDLATGWITWPWGMLTAVVNC